MIVLALPVVVIVENGVGIGHRDLTALPVLPDHDLDAAAQIQIPDLFIDPGHVNALRRRQTLNPDASVAFFLPEGRLGGPVVIGTVAANLMRDFVNLISGVEADGVGTLQLVAVEAAGHVDQQKLPGACFVVRLVFFPVPLDQAGGAEQLGDPLPFLENVQPLGKFVHHKRQLVRGLDLFQVSGLHVAADQNVPCLDLCGGF